MLNESFVFEGRRVTARRAKVSLAFAVSLAIAGGLRAGPPSASSPQGCSGALSAIAAPSIAIIRDGARISVIYTGVLQSAGNVTGPWSDVPNAVSPYEEIPPTSPRFYRGLESESIFSSRSVVALSVTGPLQLHFDLAFAGLPDGIFPPVREKPYFGASLRVAGREIPASFRVRGNSSLQECPFPKLKFKINREHRAGTPFADAREVKIGTHCAEGGSGPIGRLRDERAAWREALAYEAMELLGFDGPRVRRAQIEYHDVSPDTGGNETGWTLSRKGILLDDIEVVAERLGGRALDAAEIGALTNANFEEQLLADLRCFHALLGNWDYALSSGGRGLWNTEVIRLASGKLIPVAGDFDLASWVTGVVKLFAPWDYHPELPELERQARFELEQIRKSAGPERFAAARERFISRRAALEALVNTAEIDDAGRTNAFGHLNAFFAGLELEKPRTGSMSQ